jgi:lysozyme family protein
VPAYKSGVFTNPAKNPPGTFQKFTGAVGNLAGATATETRIYQEIFAAEGGVDVAPNGASSGITRTTLDDTIRRGEFGAVPQGTRPDQLTIDQRAAFYRAYFDDVLGAAAAALSTGRGPQGPTLKGHDLLNEISNPFAAAAIADALFHHGRGAGTRVIQQAIKDVNPTDPIGIDGKIGPKTFEALLATVSDPAKMAPLLDALAIRRAQLLQHEASRQRRQSAAAGDLARVKHFRFERVR